MFNAHKEKELPWPWYWLKSVSWEQSIPAMTKCFKVYKCIFLVLELLTWHHTLYSTGQFLPLFVGLWAGQADARLWEASSVRRASRALHYEPDVVREDHQGPEEDSGEEAVRYIRKDPSLKTRARTCPFHCVSTRFERGLKTDWTRANEIQLDLSQKIVQWRPQSSLPLSCTPKISLAIKNFDNLKYGNTRKRKKLSLLLEKGCKLTMI